MTINEDSTIAFAALFQSTILVQKIANENCPIAPEEEILIYSLLQTNPSKTIDVYKNINELALGLTNLRQYAIDKNIDLRAAIYAIHLISLQSKLVKKKSHLTQISNDIERIEKKLIHLPLTHESIIHAFAQSYSDNISALGKKIQIEGNPDYLKQSQTADRIRTLLLAGIRAITLWRQCGGKKWQYFFQRKALLLSCDALLNQRTR